MTSKKKGCEKSGGKSTGLAEAKPPWDANNLLTIPMTYTHHITRFGTTSTLVIQQDYDQGIGGVLWDCEIVLAHYIGKSEQKCLATPLPRDYWRGKHVVELGCGTALAALACWVCGAHVIATDLPAIVEKVTLRNVRANIEKADKKTQARMVCKNLEWGNDTHHGEVLKACGQKPPDVIIAADVIYLCEQYEPLLSTLRALTEHNNLPTATALILTHRKRMGHQEEFLGPLEALFFVETIIPVADVMGAEYPKPTLFILICKRRTGAEGSEAGVHPEIYPT